MMSKVVKEMFEELGYKQYKPSYIIQYRKINSSIDMHIIDFDMQRKIVFSYNNDLKPSGFDAEVHKAIHQQMKELGWLEDE